MQINPLQTRQHIVISDAAEIYVTGLSRIIKTINTSYGILHAKNLHEIEIMLKHAQIDLVIFEVNLFSGPIIFKIRSSHPRTKMIGYSTIQNYKIINDFMNKGLNGYVLKNDSRKEFTDAIQAVQLGNLYVCAQIRDIIADKKLYQRNAAEEFLEDIHNVKFREILYLIYNEFSIKQIAAELGMAEKTIEGYRTKLLKITGATNMVGLALFCQLHNIHCDVDLKNKFKIKKRTYVAL